MSQVPKIGRLVIFLHYIKKKVLKLLLRSIVIQNIHILWASSHVFCYLFIMNKYVAMQGE